MVLKHGILRVWIGDKHILAFMVMCKEAALTWESYTWVFKFILNQRCILIVNSISLIIIMKVSWKYILNNYDNNNNLYYTIIVCVPKMQQHFIEDI